MIKKSQVEEYLRTEEIAAQNENIRLSVEESSSRRGTWKVGVDGVQIFGVPTSGVIYAVQGMMNLARQYKKPKGL